MDKPSREKDPTVSFVWIRNMQEHYEAEGLKMIFILFCDTPLPQISQMSSRTKPELLQFQNSLYNYTVVFSICFFTELFLEGQFESPEETRTTGDSKA